MTIDKKMSIAKAAKSLNINHSTAKVIVRKHREMLQNSSESERKAASEKTGS